MLVADLPLICLPFSFILIWFPHDTNLLNALIPGRLSPSVIFSPHSLLCRCLPFSPPQAATLIYLWHLSARPWDQTHFPPGSHISVFRRFSTNWSDPQTVCCQDSKFWAQRCEQAACRASADLPPLLFAECDSLVCDIYFIPALWTQLWLLFSLLSLWRYRFSFCLRRMFLAFQFLLLLLWFAARCFDNKNVQMCSRVKSQNRKWLRGKGLVTNSLFAWCHGYLENVWSTALSISSEFHSHSMMSDRWSE